MARSKNPNVRGAPTSYVLQTLERSCLMAMHRELRKHGREVSTYTHDGCHVVRLPDEAAFPEALLRRCEAAIEAATDMKLALAVKPMVKTIDVPAQETLEAAYARLKAWFEGERHAVKLMHPIGYRIAAQDGGADIYCTERQPTEAFRNVRLPKPTAAAASAGGDAPFIKRWLDDATIPTYEREVFAPPSRACPSGNLNTWVPMRYTTLAAGDCASAAERERVQHEMDRIAWHIYHIACGGDGAAALWLLHFMAHMVQRPGEKPIVAVLQIGRQGVGKDSIWRWLRERVLGGRLGAYMTSASDLLGKFANEKASKILVHVEEAEAHGFAGTAAQLKAYITGGEMKVERKGVDAYMLDDFSRLVVTTNDETGAVKIGEGDRRWAVLEAFDAKKGDVAYFNALHDALQDDAVTRAFGCALAAMDITGYVLKDRPPKTAIKDAVEECTRENALSWLVDRVRDAKEGEETCMTSPEVLAAYKAWCAENGKDDSAAASNTIMARINFHIKSGVSHPRNKSARTHVFSWATIRAYMVNNGASARVRVRRRRRGAQRRDRSTRRPELRGLSGQAREPPPRRSRARRCGSGRRRRSVAAGRGATRWRRRRRGSSCWWQR